MAMSRMLFIILIVIGLAVSVAAAAHALDTKRDSRSALGWIAVCLAMPGFGAFLYFLLGVNRIRTRGRKYGERRQELGAQSGDGGTEGRGPVPALVPGRYRPLAHTAAAVTRQRLLPGNTIEALYGGEEAYQAMLVAIAEASATISLATYLFDSDGTGRSFVGALQRAVERGVEVRVLLDGFGQVYSWPPSRRLLRRAGVPYAEFLPLSPFRSRLHLNLRNHRKLLVVDRRVGFTGGMNIGDRHLVGNTDNPRRVNDIHFRITGPAVLQMEETFRNDWAFVTGEAGEPVTIPDGLEERPVLIRGIVDGPNEDFEKLQRILIGAFHAARSRLRIMTPYFVPGREVMSALCAAALRGVEVDILLPGTNNHPLVGWASWKLLDELLEYGVRVAYQPPPFDHTKLLLVDDLYCLVGSANLDARSLRLNFEFNLEVYDRALTAELGEHFARAFAGARVVGPEDVARRRLPVRLRDGLAWLLSPYL